MGWRTVKYYTIKSSRMTLEVTIDDECGIIDGHMTQDYQPIYELGSSIPTEFIPPAPQIYYRSV